ncbi:MmcQ/YjbR family DNA-binding protein [Ferrimonas lipolytica]|uniref:MmcQ/YjbR family DNA-binding protein n=1 Tax=Ferrimonas lipolytica TaxID=2724191 RepID=A0A6H1UEU4_9GAMM|nr:MmcQ/YjbR family DNA-binding protein [Ferrimonas lipolytica]QIZ77564.1 MmcQ/YjbR family DNA-binding protein [Ferrimonas lipolytica]
MTYDQFNQLCQSLPASSYVMQWNNAHVWKVGDKVFAIGGWSNDKSKPAFIFKASEHNYLFLSEQPGYRPAPYFATRGMKWIQHFDSSPSTDEELRYYLTESHRIVSLGLTKKKQRQLGLNQS